jgi:GNAT superfamily N-acetyltransferase
MPNEIVIRRATSADRETLDRIVQDSRAYDGAYRAIIDNYPVTDEMIARDAMYLAELNGRTIGFYSLTLDEPEIDLMFVDNNAQGTGAGRALFEHMRETARDHGFMRVKIVSHPPSEGFYLRMGAQRMGAQRTGTRQPRGHVSWEQPILELTI